MADKGARRLSRLIKPLRIAPGRKVDLALDFDPRYKANDVKRKHSAQLLNAGIAMLADYQARLAAQAEQRERFLKRIERPDKNWYVIPADRKRFARICAAAVPGHALAEIDPQYPKVSLGTRQRLMSIGQELKSNAV